MLSHLVNSFLSKPSVPAPAPADMECKSVCIFQGKLDKAATRAIHLPLIVRQTPPSPLADTSSESKETPTEAQPSERPFRPSEDVLYIREDDFRHFTQFGLEDAPWAPELTHLAIPLSQFDQGLWLPLAFRYMPKLKTLSFVFPKSSGTIDIYAPVKLTRRQEAHTLLRKLTPDEAKNLKLDANYTREDPMGYHRVKYTTNATDHTKWSFEKMEQSTASNDPVHMPPYCDKESRELKIACEMACFLGS